MVEIVEIWFEGGKVADCSVIGDNETRKSGWWVTQWGLSRVRTKVSMRETLVIARLGESIIFIAKM